MSDFINPDKAHLWLDGDAFRAPIGTALPSNVFASTLPGFTAFGGIKAGFKVTPSQDSKEADIWNNKTGAAYKRVKGKITTVVAFRPVDYSVATCLTMLRGGSIAGGVGGGYEWIDGDDEEFAFLMRVADGDDKKVYFVERGELTNLPEESMGDEDDMEGFDLEISPLAPATGNRAIRKITSFNPLA